MICLLADCTVLTGWPGWVIGWLNFISIPVCVTCGLRILGEMIGIFFEYKDSKSNG
jgi:hypothetical protein